MSSNTQLWGALALSAVLALGSASCAVQGGAPVANGPSPSLPQSPAARMGLAPALRPFYDELEPYGDWILVEPQGWVFRPRVNTVAWRPYQDGHWEPSYAFGWVWQSNDPFGWITDHYGFWFHDDFQGWVWQPYGAWAPSWVAWVQVGDFVGWAPLAPANATGYDTVPGGVFTFVPKNVLAQSGAGSSASYVGSLPNDGSPVRPIERVSSYQGAYFNAGPDLGEVLGPAQADRLRLDEREGRAVVPAPSRRSSGNAPALELSVLENRSRLAWSQARRELSALRERQGGGQAPAPASPPPSPAPPPRIKPQVVPGDTLVKGAPQDSLRKHLRRQKPRPARPPGAGTD